MVRGRSATGRALLLAAVLALLAGCVKLDADLTVGTDGTVTGRYVVAYLKDPAKPETGLAPPRELLVGQGSAEQRRYDDGRYAGTEYDLRGVSFADLAAFAPVSLPGRQTGTLRLVRDGDDVTVGGVFDFRETSTVTRTPAQQEEAERAFSVRVRLTFPGDVQVANGRIEGRTVTWDVPPFVRTTLQARAGALPAAPPQPSGLGARSVAGYAVPVAAGLAVLLVLVLLARRRRRPAPVPPPADPADFSWVVADRTRGGSPPRRTAPPEPTRRPPE